MYLTYSILFTGPTDVGIDRQAQSRLVRTCLVCPAYVVDRSESLRPEVHGLPLGSLSTASAGQVHRGLLGDCLGNPQTPPYDPRAHVQTPNPKIRAHSIDINLLDHTHSTHLPRPGSFSNEAKWVMGTWGESLGKICVRTRIFELRYPMRGGHMEDTERGASTTRVNRKHISSSVWLDHQTR